MVGMTDYCGDGVLNHIVGKTAIFALTAPYVALFTAVGTDAGTGFTEVSGGGYARMQVPGASWNAASGSMPSLISNLSAITFPTATADWGTVIAFGLYDAATGGNLRTWDYIGNFAWLPFTCSLATPGVLTVPAHGMANADQLVVTAEFGGTLPATAGSWAGLLAAANATTDTLTLGVNTTGTGSGFLRKVVSQHVTAGVTYSAAPGALALSAG